MIIIEYKSEPLYGSFTEIALSFSGLRKVYPYYFTFTTFTKGRWVGEKILDVFGREFRAHPVEEYVSEFLNINAKFSICKAVPRLFKIECLIWAVPKLAMMSFKN